MPKPYYDILIVVEAFPQIPKEDWEALPPPAAVPQKQELTEFWGSISALSPEEQQLAIDEFITPYIGGDFIIRWDSPGQPKHTKAYRFHGVITDDEGRQYYQLENTSFTRRFNLEQLKKIQERDGVVYPTIPIDREFNQTNGGPTSIWLRIPDEMTVESRSAA